MATSQGKNSSNSKSAGRPARVWAAIILLVIVVGAIFYFNRDTPLPKELKEVISTETTTDSVWTYSSADTNTISLKTPPGDVYVFIKNGDGFNLFINGKPANVKEMDKHLNEITALSGELRKRNKR